MKYLAVLFLSLVSLWNTAGASQSPSVLPLQVLAPTIGVDRVLSDGTSLGDRALAGALAAALIALQLRRRQKSLRIPRLLLN